MSGLQDPWPSPTLARPQPSSTSPAAYLVDPGAVLGWLSQDCGARSPSCWQHRCAICRYAVIFPGREKPELLETPLRKRVAAACARRSSPDCLAACREPSAALALAAGGNIAAACASAGPGTMFEAKICKTALGQFCKTTLPRLLSRGQRIQSKCSKTAVIF